MLVSDYLKNNKTKESLLVEEQIVIRYKISNLVCDFVTLIFQELDCL